MNIAETRKKLKLSEKKYSDEDVQAIIEYTESLADIFLDQHKRKTNNENKELLPKPPLKKISLFTNIRYNQSGNKSKINNTSGKKMTLN